MTDMRDYKEKAEEGKAACLKTLKDYKDIVSACEYLGIEVPEDILRGIEETKERLQTIQDLEHKLDIRSN